SRPPARPLAENADPHPLPEPSPRCTPLLENTPRAEVLSYLHGHLGALVRPCGIGFRVEIGRIGALSNPAHLERAFLGHARIAAGARADHQRVAGRVIADRDARDLALLVAVTHAVVFIELETA